jgi:hypothetical protein
MDAEILLVAVCYNLQYICATVICSLDRSMELWTIFAFNAAACYIYAAARDDISQSCCLILHLKCLILYFLLLSPAGPSKPGFYLAVNVYKQRNGGIPSGSLDMCS